MSLFCIIGFNDKDTTQLREKYGALHIEHLSKLKKDGKLIAAGPLMNSESDKASASGSLLIVDFASKIEAETWFKKDSYYLNGVYESLKVIPYIDAMDIL